MHTCARVNMLVRACVSVIISTAADITMMTSSVRPRHQNSEPAKVTQGQRAQRWTLVMCS